MVSYCRIYIFIREKRGSSFDNVLGECQLSLDCFIPEVVWRVVSLRIAINSNIHHKIMSLIITVTYTELVTCTELVTTSTVKS